MSNSLTDIVKHQNKRLQAMETEDVDIDASVAQITKVFGSVKLLSGIECKIHQYKVLGVFKVGDTL